MTISPDPDTSRIYFRVRFNTAHGDTDLYWRVIVDGTEHLVRNLRCEVPTFSDEWLDPAVGKVKYHIAGECVEFVIDNELTAIFK